MGDEDKVQFGELALFMGKSEADMKPPGNVVENNTKHVSNDAAELDRLSVQFDFQMPKDDSLVSLLGADFASEPSKKVCSCIIRSEPKINKPKGLKYPNKKRARRVWKKWKRRFGTRPGKMLCLPDVEIESEYDVDRMSMRVNVKPIKNSNGNN